MNTTTIIDRRARPPADRSHGASPAADMAAHLLALTALVMALTTKACAAITDAEREDLLSLFVAQSESMAAQYAGDVQERAARLTGALAAQLRALQTVPGDGNGG